MPNAKKSRRGKPGNKVARNSTGAKVKSTQKTSAKLTATPVDSSTGMGVLGFFTSDSEGCHVRFGIEQQGYQLALTRPNYNAMFSHLLACWLNGSKVSFGYAPPIKSPSGLTSDRRTITSITSLPS